MDTNVGSEWLRVRSADVRSLVWGKYIKRMVGDDGTNEPQHITNILLAIRFSIL